MKIIVPVQQVFDPRQIRISSQGRLVSEGAARLIESASKAALEAALRLKDALGGTVDVIALGGPEVEESLREAQAMGADRAYLVTDQAFSSPDAGVVAMALGVAIQRIGEVDLVVVGEGGALSGPMLAEGLGLSQVTQATNLAIDIKGANCGLTADQAWDGGSRHVGAPLPALVTVAAADYAPRYPHVARVMAVFSEPTLTVWSAADLGLETDQISAEASRTQVRRTAAPDARVLGERITGTAEEQARSLVGKLRARGLL
jgi:electron transfer flavoprotein alpha/beta subunit